MCFSSASEIERGRDSDLRASAGARDRKTRIPTAVLLLGVLITAMPGCPWSTAPIPGDQGQGVGSGVSEQEFQGMREQMVQVQLESRDVRDPLVLAAMRLRTMNLD